MNIETDAVVPFPRPEVFRAYRDHLTDLVEYLPNVKNIEIESREEDGSTVRLVNVWHGGGEIPASLRKFLSESMLSWHDYATWTEDDWRCEWNIVTHSFQEAVHCNGTNEFIEIGGGDRTRLEIRGKLDIDLKRVRGVPSMLAGSLGRTVEQFLIKQITANLSDVSEGITRYLQSRQDN